MGLTVVLAFLTLFALAKLETRVFGSDEERYRDASESEHRDVSESER